MSAVFKVPGSLADIFNTHFLLALWPCVLPIPPGQRARAVEPQRQAIICVARYVLRPGHSMNGGKCYGHDCCWSSRSFTSASAFIGA